jgi:hypothetical protein
MPNPQDSTLVIGKRTGIQLWVVVGMCALVVSVMFWVVRDSVWKSNIKRDVLELRQDMVELKIEVLSRSADRWYRTQMIIWTRELRASNPNLIIPKVEDVPYTRQAE